MWVFYFVIIVGIIGAIFSVKERRLGIFLASIATIALLSYLLVKIHEYENRPEPQFTPVPAAQLLEIQISNLDLPIALVTPERAVELIQNLRTRVHTGRMLLNQYDVSPKICKIQLLGGAYAGLISVIYNDIGETGLTDDDSFIYTFSLNDWERVYLVETNPLSGSKFHIYEDNNPLSVSNEVTSVKNLQDEQFFAQTLRAAALYLLEQELAAKNQ